MNWQDMDYSREQIIQEARKHHGDKWPESLWTGVMFFMGQRITKQEFEAK